MSLSFLDRMVEERIAAAERRGEFDNLPGRGQLLSFADERTIPGDLRLAYKILKNANCIPPEPEVRREIVRLRDLIAMVHDSEDREPLIRDPVAWTTHIGTSVAAKRCQIRGGEDETMLFHWEESSTTKMVSFRRIPTSSNGRRWGSTAISLLRAVVDGGASTSRSRRDLACKTHRRWSRYGWYRSLDAAVLRLNLVNPRRVPNEIDSLWMRRVDSEPGENG